MKKKRRYELLLAVVLIARSSSYVISKTALHSLAPFNLLALRFLIAFFLLATLCWKRLRNIGKKELRGGILLGAIFSVVMSMEMLGLQRADTATASFIENSAMIFVPLILLLVYMRIPGKMEILRILLAMTGIGFLTMGQSGGIFQQGTTYLILAAIFYALAIVETEKVTKSSDALSTGIVQIGVMGIVTLGISLLTEHFQLPGTLDEWGMVLALTVICSGFGFVFQTVAQKEVSAERAGAMCAINPLCAAIMGMVFLREPMEEVKIVGCMLILGSLFLDRITMRTRTNRRENLWRISLKQEKQ